MDAELIAGESDGISYEWRRSTGTSAHYFMCKARQANNAKKHPGGRHKTNRGVEKILPCGMLGNRI
jgi:hypothetical protein